MRYYKRKHGLTVLVFLILALAAATVVELHTLWRAGYSRLYMSTDQTNLATRVIIRAKAFFYTKVLVNQDTGMPFVRLYISKKAQADLLEDLPNRLKTWQSAHMVYPDGKLRKIKVRHRGDNPINWLYTTKSWRVKTKKGRMIQRVRKFNYIKIQEHDYLSQILGYDIHARLGLTTQKARLIELFINDISNGLYLEVEQLDESFLRNNNLMPTNLYKGEQYNTERIYGQEHDLFNNTALWKKVAVFNQLPKDDYSDLSRLFSLIKRAGTDKTAFAALARIARFEDWAAFSAFQTLAQSWGNDYRHNMRLISDPWKGTVRPLSHDTGTGFNSPAPFRFGAGSHALLRLYNQDSAFLWAKHQALKRAIDDGVLPQAAADMENQLAAIERSAERDPGRTDTSSGSGLFISFDMDALKVMHRNILKRMRALHGALADALNAPPGANWTADGRVLTLTVDGYAPVSAVRLVGAGAVTTVYWDRDGDSVISDGDLRLPVKGGEIQATFYANRDGDGGLAPAAFRLLFSGVANVSGISVANPLTTARITVKKEEAVGRTPGPHNVPLMEAAAPDEIVLQGRLSIRGVRVFDAPVTIRPGTIMEMQPGASLVFRNVVTVNGTTGQPVLIRAANHEMPWGVFAIYGAKASGSRIRHLQLEGGSGQTIDGVHFIAMLSVHDTTDVEFDAITLRGNKVFDDAMHVIYSKNIRLKNSLIENAFSDALDVDISEIEITGTVITGAGNDAIDLMSSRALIQRSQLIGARDKGVSVGEASTALIVNSLLRDNGIGLESKDGSDSYILNSDMIGNKTQVHAYRKNWRYGGGGSIVINKVFMQGQRNIIKTGKRSRIRLDDNTLSPRPQTKGRRITVSDDNSFETGVRTALSPDYAGGVENIMRQFGIGFEPQVRGIQP